MVIATHIIKVKGEFDIKLWNETSLREYVNKKIMEIEDCLHPDLELFNVRDNCIDVWVFVSALPSEVSQMIVEIWIKRHITDKGLSVEDVSIEILYDITKSPGSQVETVRRI